MSQYRYATQAGPIVWVPEDSTTVRLVVTDGQADLTFDDVNELIRTLGVARGEVAFNELVRDSERAE